MNSAASFTIGRSAENHLVVNQPGVSRQHARVTFITDHVVLLEDADSTYGTFVDGRRVARTVIGTESRIVFGQGEPTSPQVIFDLKNREVALVPVAATYKPGKLTAPRAEFSEISETSDPIPVPVAKSDPLDFREEFKRLEAAQQTYATARELIQVNSPRQQAWVRAGFGLTGLLGFAFPALLAVGVLGAVIGQIVAAEFLNPAEKLLALDKEFKRLYVCPSCGVFLGNIPYPDLIRRKQCRECKAKWVDG